MLGRRCKPRLVSSMFYKTALLYNFPLPIHRPSTPEKCPPTFHPVRPLSGYINIKFSFSFPFLDLIHVFAIYKVCIFISPPSLICLYQVLFVTLVPVINLINAFL